MTGVDRLADRGLLRLEAAIAQRNGIDVFQPGWRDEYLAMCQEHEKERRQIDDLIGTPHVDEAITGMEQQFEDEGGAS